MTKQQLKIRNPELYAAIRSLGYREGYKRGVQNAKQVMGVENTFGIDPARFKELQAAALERGGGRKEFAVLIHGELVQRAKAREIAEIAKRGKEKR